MTLQLIQFPEHFAALDIPAALRILADNIEAGEAGLTAHFLAAAAQKRILNGVAE